MNDTTETPKEAAKPSATFKKYAEKYKATGGHNGDAIAVALKASPDFVKVAEENKIDLARWAHLNKGMQRMAVGNVLRGMAKKGTAITIDGKPITI